MSDPTVPSAVSPPASAVDGAAARLVAITGARPALDDCGPQALFPEATPSDGFVAPLPDMSVIGVRGADATAFLQSQFTNDVAAQAPDEVRWNGWCSAKGRLMATFACWKEHEDGGDAWMLALSAPLLERTRKRLSMFVLRAKAVLRDESADRALLGLAGPAGERALRALGIAPPMPMRVARGEGCTALALTPVPVGEGAEATCPRWLLAVPTDRLEAVWARLAAVAPAASSTAWRWLEVRAGVPRIAAGAHEQFVPQMLNFELVGGVDFRKGCYPGQEVVARSQYLGKLKRRMFAFHADGPAPEAGADVTRDGDAEPAGRVVLAAPCPGGGADLLAELPTDRVDGAPLRLAADGPALVRIALPYDIPAPSPAVARPGTPAA